MRGGLWRRLLWMGLLSAAVRLPAQDLDANVTVRTRQPSAIADEIADPSERAAFLKLFHKQSTSSMRRLAEEFVERFPRSAFLAQAYELAAKASFDTADYARGIEDAQASLRFLPENPSLLVALADVEAREKLNGKAIGHAQQALDELEQFARPASVEEKNWAETKKEQQAVAWFAMGRARLQAALDMREAEVRRQRLSEALNALAQSRKLKPLDPEIQYMQAMALLSDGQLEAGGSELAGLKDGSDEIATRASAALQDLFAGMKTAGDRSFDAFLDRIRHIEPSAKAERASLVAAERQLPSGYAGSQMCKGCHGAIYRNWSQTGMATMLRPYEFKNVTGDFTGEREFYIGDDTEYVHGKLTSVPEAKRQLFARMTTEGGRHCFKILQSDGAWHTYPVDYTIGSKWQQAYATRLPNGEIHVLPIQYSMREKRWMNYWRSLDGPGTERSDPRNFERLDSATNYQQKCAICHTSQLRNPAGGGLDADGLEFKEAGVGCEMCHGPSASHAAAMQNGEVGDKAADEPPIDFKGIDNREFVAICAQCHMQSALRQAGPHGELNYSTAGKFYQIGSGVPYGEFTRKGFYKDGRFSQTTFIVEALRRTRCFQVGKISCGTCHDPHGHDFSSNQTSLRYKDAPDKMCTGCHTQFQSAAATAAHSHHVAESEGSRCVSCHMPRIMDALTFSARTHEIDDIPDGEMTLRFGQTESPNACLLCHQGKSPQWASEQLKTWQPARPELRPTVLANK